jgi:hypothetical protein
VKFTFEVTVTVPPGGSEHAGDYAVDMAEATSALGFDVSAFELLEVHGTPAEYNAVYCCSTRQEGTE